ncbi:MAG: hypothetical protein AAB847_02580 [Patescibacteria group bacterium]|mgnify:CR=1 FL=1
MQVIPSINAADFEEAKNLILQAEKFSDWIHIDVGDGIWTPNQTWNSPSEFQEIRNPKSEIRNLKTEIHLMIESPDIVVLPWLETGAKRIIVHVESVEDPESLIELCEEFDAELGLAISPETKVEELNVYFNPSPLKDYKESSTSNPSRVRGKVKFYQVLAVTPGLAGQKFNQSVLKKIEFLRAAVPDAIIEVDGGINPETARMVKKAGADIIVSASYIWNSDDPKKAYYELT